MQKGYKEANIQNQIFMVDNLDSKLFLITSKPIHMDIIIYFLTCNPSVSNVNEVTNKHWQMFIMFGDAKSDLNK